MLARAAAATAVLAVPAALMPAPANAAPHGCVSVTNHYNVHVDVARHSFGLQVYRNAPCTFYFSPGDTYSGSGEYTVSCATGGFANDSRAMGPQALVPIPQPCAPGALVTIDASQPWHGGAVVAGSLT